MKFSVSYGWGWSPKPKIHLAITISMAVFTGFLALYLYFNAVKHLSDSIITEGVVVDSNVSTSGMYTPIIEFQLGEGKTARFVSSFSSNPQKYFNGDTVEVIVSSETGKPDLLNFLTLYGLTCFAAVCSVISMLGSLGVYFLRVRNA